MRFPSKLPAVAATPSLPSLKRKGEQGAFLVVPDDQSRLPRALTDQALLRECLSQEEEALSAFYDRFAPRLYALVHAILRDQKEAEEVLQLAFLQIWRRAAAYDPRRATVFAWSVRIARQRALEKLRARPRPLESRPPTAGGDDPAEEPEESPDLRAERARVRAALGHLLPEQRAALDLAFFSGLRQAEIAATLGVAVTTVRGQLRNGLLGLGTALAQESSAIFEN